MTPGQAMLARSDTDGFDFRVDHDFDWAGNRFGFSANVALTRSYLEDINAFDPVEAEEHVGLWVSRLGYLASAYWGAKRMAAGPDRTDP